MSRSQAAAQLSRDDHGLPNLSVDVIVDVAMQLVRRDGFEKLALPQVAASLEVTTPALYHHVRNRGALLELVAERIMTSVQLPPPKDSWQKRLSTLLISHDAVMRTYPGLYRFLLNSNAGRGRLCWIESRLSVLRDAGFAGPALIRAFLLISFYTNPLVLVDGADSVTARNFRPGQLDEALKSSPGEFPALRQTLPELQDISYDIYFRSGLERLIASVAAELPQ